MTPSSESVDGLSRELWVFAEQQVGQIHNVEDCSGPRENSRVWRITAGRHHRTSYLKQHPSPTFHAREVQAYAHWTPALPHDQAPQLLAADPALSAMLLTALPGITPDQHSLPIEDEQEIHRQLGLLLAAFHHSQPRRPPTQDHPDLGSLQRHLAAASPYLTAGDGVLAGRMAVRLATLAPLPHVPTHGDAQLRNTVWNPETRTLALIDYERAAYAPAVRDLIRLQYGPWDKRPDLKTAFFTGFGQALTQHETQHLQAMAALDAISGIAYGVTAGDDDVIARGHRTLARLHTPTNPHHPPSTEDLT
ncbi:aminoglycoside phosphotransferase family protein [Streptomyces sp. V4-01]|uniref:Aminoglycoside phosphotransferase family protein n=1 Tax=Actinacidiphila polyblastidii TaxID=3110430 RepID=A0ABU7PDR9_9ACTN|nr:aminoglycoside phosphotransferase family protein [Streptomyces sp. V4-01]